jgi:protocatechuate 3,4-dioxygenase beta subunit
VTLKKSIALVALGIVIGSLSTLTIFTLLSGDQPDKAQIIDTGRQQEPETRLPGYTPSSPEQFTRDIKGNCSFSGTVVDQQANPIPQAQVRLRLLDQPWSSPDPPLETQTDKNGQFQINNLSEKLAFQVWVWAPNYGVASHEQIPCGSRLHLALEKSASLDLTFTDPEGNPVGPAYVQLIGSDLWPARQGYSSPEGQLTIHGLRSGEYTVWADTKNLAYLSGDPIQVKQGEETKAELVLTPSRSAKVIVVDKRGGNPVEDATVLVGPSSTYLMHKTARTGTDGSTLVSSLPDSDYTVTVMAHGFRTHAPVPIRLDDDNVIALDVGITLSGTVHTAEGTPIANASIEGKKGLGNSLVRLPTGRGLELRNRILFAARSGWPNLYEVQSGKFVPGPTNIPIPNDSSYTVTKAPAKHQGRQTTDKRGRFRLEGLPSGKVALRAQHPDFVMANRVELILEHGKELPDIDIVMRTGTTLSVRVLDDRGFPIPGAEVNVFNIDQERIATATSGQKGYVKITGLPGIFHIESSADGYVSATEYLRVRTGSENEVTLTLPAADKRLRGRVLDNYGFGISGAIVTARTITKGLLHALTCLSESDGTFVLEKVGSGGYHVIADAGDRGRAQVPDAYFDIDIKLVLSSEKRLEKPVVKTTNPAINQRGFNNPTDIPFAETEFVDSDDDLDTLAGHMGDDDIPPTINTPFGEAETLPVTDTPRGKGSLPITIGGRSGKIIVTHIQSGSRVAMAGLSKGDRIVAINNRKLSGPASARRALEGPIGSVVTMTIENDGEQFTVIVQRVRVK